MNAVIKDFKNYLVLDRQFSPHTVAAYGADTREYLLFCQENNADHQTVTETFLDEYIYYLKNTKGLSPRSVFRKTEAVKSFYKYLLINGVISNDPCKYLVSPRLTRAIPSPLTPGEMHRLLSFPPQNFAELRTLTILELFYACGLRVSELTGLRLENINIKDGWVLASGKGGKQRFVPMHGHAAELVGKYLDEREKTFAKINTDSEVFVGKKGKKLSRQSVWKDISELGKKAGIARPLYPHLFRHTFASHMLLGGADLRSLQEMLGHANLDTTQIYTQLDLTDIKEKHKKFHPRG